MVTEITKKSEFARAVNSKPVVVVDFYATWCGPCKKMARVLEDWEVGMADNGEDWLVGFVKVNVDEQPQLARDHDVSALPTFVVFASGERAGAVRGADRQQLRDHIERAMQRAVRQRDARASAPRR